MLHIVIGCVIAFISLIVVMAIVSSTRDITVLDDVESADSQVVAAAGLAFWLSLLGGQLGWMLFVYLRRPALTRTIALVASLGVAVTVAVVILVGALPAIPD